MEILIDEFLSENNIVQLNYTIDTESFGLYKGIILR